MSSRGGERERRRGNTTEGLVGDCGAVPPHGYVEYLSDFPCCWFEPFAPVQSEQNSLTSLVKWPGGQNRAGDEDICSTIAHHRLCFSYLYSRHLHLTKTLNDR